MAHSLSGRIYLNSWQEYEDRTRQTVYGKDYDSLVHLKRQIDPNFVFNPDVLRIQHHKG